MSESKVNVTRDGDDPSWDGTDAAHPAWWRGNDAGVDGAVMVIEKVLSGEEPRGFVNHKRLQQLRLRVAALVSDKLLQSLENDPVWQVAGTPRAYDHGPCTDDVQMALDEAKRRVIALVQEHRSGK